MKCAQNTKTSDFTDLYIKKNIKDCVKHYSITSVVSVFLCKVSKLASFLTIS